MGIKELIIRSDIEYYINTLKSKYGYTFNNKNSSMINAYSSSRSISILFLDDSMEVLKYVRNTGKFKEHITFDVIERHSLKYEDKSIFNFIKDVLEWTFESKIRTYKWKRL